MKIVSVSPGCRLINIETSKFKDVTVNLRFNFPLTKENIVFSNLCAGIITDQCAAYPNKACFSRQLDQLYGAVYFAGTVLRGAVGSLSVVARVVNGRFIGEDILNKQLATLKEVVLRPVTTGDMFSPSLFAEAQNNLLAALARDKDRPNYYAYQQAIKIYGVDYPLALNGGGTEAGILEADNNEVYRWYKELCASADLEMIVIGDTDEKALLEFLDDFNQTKRAASLPFCYKKPAGPYQQASESGKIDQSQLLMFYHHPLNSDDPAYYQSAVACTLFGQIPTSLLFKEVREKRSLCYSVYSRLFPYENTMMVATGIDKANIESTSELIEELRQEVAKGNFADELVDMAKDMLINSYTTAADEPEGYVNEALRRLHVDDRQSTEEVIERIKAVSKVEVMACFAKLKLETVFSYQQED